MVQGRHRKLMPAHGERTVWAPGGARDLTVFDMRETPNKPFTPKKPDIPYSR